MKVLQTVAPVAIRSGKLLLLAVLVTVSACDFTVENPGPVQEEQLNREESLPAVMHGMERALGEALTEIAYTSGAIAKEITAAGSINTCGITLTQRDGELVPDEVNPEWNLAQQARWVAEDGVRRMREVMGEEFSSSALAAEALLYVGYANRLLGENMCQAVIDGSEPQPRSVYFERAETAFSEALEIARNVGSAELEHAALAGRAAVHVFRGNWEEAVSDAEQVPEDFVFAIEYHDVSDDQYNQLYWCNANQPFRAHSVIGTYYEDYYEQTGDPRVPWDTNPEFPVGDTGEIPWLFQTKYNSLSSPINLSSGREMKLIIAEARLRNGNWQEALRIINELRAEVDVEAREASGPAEVWQWLERERGIELWLEARRLGDIRRWLEEGVPSGGIPDMTGQDLCYPVGLDEIETNPNVPAP